jgi:hypothetical protein
MFCYSPPNREHPNYFCKVKIFGIGLSKTGISSLNAALSLLGYLVKKFPLSIEEACQFDAATDSPVALWFQDLDCRCPGSKFIYTTRNKADWLQSCEMMWGRQGTYFRDSAFISAIHQALFSTVEFSPDTFSKAYDRHDSRVRSHFKTRERDLLYLDIAASNKWERLCRFLDTAVPDSLWPHENASAVIKELAVHLAQVTGDLALVTELTGISTAHLKQVQASASARHPFDEAILKRDRGWEIRRFVLCAVRRFGSPAVASRECGLSVETIESLQHGS